MIKDFEVSDELKSKLIDFIYSVSYNARGWMRDEAKELIKQLEKR